MVHVVYACKTHRYGCMVHVVYAYKTHTYAEALHTDIRVKSEGLLGFVYSAFRLAVERRYLRTEADRRRIQLRLAEYFERQHTPLGAPPAHALARHLLGDALPLLARRAQVVEAAQERSGRGGQHHHICCR